MGTTSRRMGNRFLRRLGHSLVAIGTGHLVGYVMDLQFASFVFAGISTAITLGIAWGVMRASVKGLQVQLDELRAQKASMDSIQVVLTRIVGLEEQVRIQFALFGQRITELRHEN